jgi:hypothetical protein
MKNNTHSAQCRGIELLFRMGAQATRRCYTESVGSPAELRLKFASRIAALEQQGEEFVGVEDIFFVGGQFEEGVLLGFHTLPGIEGVQDAMEYCDRDSDQANNLELETSESDWWLVKMVYWIPGNDSVAVEATMAARETGDNNSFCEKIDFLEYEEPFFDALVMALKLNGDEIQNIKRVCTSAIIPIEGDPARADPFSKETGKWDDAVVADLLSDQEIEEHLRVRIPWDA